MKLLKHLFAALMLLSIIAFGFFCYYFYYYNGNIYIFNRLVLGMEEMILSAITLWVSFQIWSIIDFIEREKKIKVQKIQAEEAAENFRQRIKILEEVVGSEKGSNKKLSEQNKELMKKLATVMEEKGELSIQYNHIVTVNESQAKQIDILRIASVQAEKAIFDYQKKDQLKSIKPKKKNASRKR